MWERPPWWPEGEPFPPARSERHRARHRFLRRVLVRVAIFFVLVSVISATVGRLLGLNEDHAGRGFGFLLPLLLIVSFVAITRFVRRVALPVSDVMEAADRVAGGDYSARVEPRGSRETRRLARAFNQMTERLSEDEQRRRDLLADLAHELRTPLSVIRANLEAMADGVHAVDEAHLRPVIDETVVMGRLLEDLQLLSTADAGALRLHRERVPARALAEDAVTAFATAAEGRGVTLRLDAPDDLPEVDVDPGRVGQVLAILLSNAIRHAGDGGEVTVSVATASAAQYPTDEPPFRAVTIRVSDTGPGIAADVLPHIFERFSGAADTGGSGLGLAIAKRLVEAHGGTIGVHSAPGHGATFHVLLPIDAPS